MRLPIISAIALSLAVLSSCQAEGPFSDLTVHHPVEPHDVLAAFSAAATDGVVEDGVLTVIPQLIADVEGTFVNDVYLSYNVDGGESIVKGPVETGRPVHYDLDGKVWPGGGHTVSGRLYTMSAASARTVLTTFECPFSIVTKDTPVVEDEYLVSITRGSTVIPLHTTETATLVSGADCTLKIDFKGKGSGKVSIKNIDYTFSLLDFKFAEKFEGEGLATIPFGILKTGTAFVTLTFTRGTETYKPTYQIDIVL